MSVALLYLRHFSLSLSLKDTDRNQGLRKLNASLAKSNAVFIFLNQIRNKIGVMYSTLISLFILSLKKKISSQ
jgi:RecA/RadA recombinase